MDRSATWTLGVLLAVGLAMYWRVSPVAAEKPSIAQKQTQEEKSPMAPAWAAELMEIRKQLGANPLEGSLFDLPPGDEAVEQAEFLEALQRASVEAPSTLPTSAVNASRHAETEAPFHDAILISALRHAAACLDDAANRHESAEAYLRADSYFKLARRLRQEARRLADSAQP